MPDVPLGSSRKARASDARAMVQLVNMAGEGLPYYLWSKMVVGSESPWDIGRSRAQRKEGAFSYRNGWVYRIDQRVVALLVGYPLPVKLEKPNYDNMPAMFVPLQQLEDLVPDTWYLNVLACYPEWRGQGIGRRLLELAEIQAHDCKKSVISIIVSDANQGARRLYEKMGYREYARRPMVKENWENPGKQWSLLTKTL